MTVSAEEKRRRKKPHRLKVGMKVVIEGRVRTLSMPIHDIAYGWVVNKPVDGFRCWHESSMRVYKG